MEHRFGLDHRRDQGVARRLDLYGGQVCNDSHQVVCGGRPGLAVYHDSNHVKRLQHAGLDIPGEALGKQSGAWVEPVRARAVIRSAARWLDPLVLPGGPGSGLRAGR